jgi:hypothetical protein
MPSYQQHFTAEDVAQSFVTFAQSRCQGQFGSLLYDFLSRKIAEDPETLDIARYCPRRPIPQLFLGVVQYLLMNHPEDTLSQQLSQYYPSLNASLNNAPLDAPELYPTFRTFCQAYRQQIIEQLAFRIVQTNHVTRCSALLPAFTEVARREGKALSIIEIGASAGFNLSWDNYQYAYRNGTTVRLGNEKAPMMIECTLHGSKQPPLKEPFPSVAYRVGIDLHPINAHAAEEVLWLRALIWPERKEYVSFLEQSVRIAQAQPLNLVQGDAIAELPSTLKALNTIASNTTWCVLSSYMLFQLDEAGRNTLHDIIAAAAQGGHTVYWVAIEWYDIQSPSMYLSVFRNGKLDERTLLARCCGQGDWLEWLSD